jgi:hypothetical protein
MKRTALAVAVAVVILAAFAAQAQSTNVTSVPNLLGTMWDTMVGQGLTNLNTTVYGTYTPKIKEWGEGIVITRNIPFGESGIGTGIGVGVDHYSDEWYGITAQVGLQAATRPLAGWGGKWTNVVMTPFTYIALGTPFGNQTGGTAGNLETIAGVGDGIHLAHVLGMDLDLVGVYGTRSGLGAAGGVFYGGGLNLTKKF